MKMLPGLDIAVFSLKSSSSVKLRKLVVDAKVFAINSSCSRKTNVESSADGFGWVSCEDAIIVLAAFRWTCQIEESMRVSVSGAIHLNDVR